MIFMGKEMWRKKYIYCTVASCVMFLCFGFETYASSVIDTIPLTDQDGDFITSPNKNPFDLKPSIITQEVEYDPSSGHYIIMEKIGDEYYRTPSYMTFDEYMTWKSKQEEKRYFQRLAGLETNRKVGFKTGFDPMSKIDVKKSIIDRLFGGTEVDIKPQGSVDLTLGFFDYQRRDDPSLPRRQQRRWFIPGDFKIDPKLSVDGGIGDKLNLNFNYDLQSTFNFDKQIKLEYDSDAFSEDDIIKKIEAGNVSLPLKGSLIQGNQTLFGLKTEFQFGKLRFTAIASQQRSKQNNRRMENGVSEQEFEIRPDEYDENRHFFLSHYNRNTYERTLENLPQINTSFRVQQIEVWISDDRPEYQEGSTMIAGIADLAEPELDKYGDPDNPRFPPVALESYLTDITGLPLADNRVNGIFAELVDDKLVNELDQTSSELTSARYQMVQTRDFEIFRGRLLNPSEYTFHPELGFLSLNIRLRPNQILSVSYKYNYTARCDTVYTVGQMAGEGLEISETRASVPEAPKVIFTKLLKSSNQRVELASYDLMMKNVYNLRTSQLNKEGFEFDIFYEDDFDDGSLKKFIPEEDLRFNPLLNVFNLDNLNRFGDPQPDGIFDYVPGVTVIERTGSIVYPVLEPFGSSLEKIFTDTTIAEKYLYKELYNGSITNARQTLYKNKFVMKGRVKSSNSGEINLGPFVPRGSVRVTAGGRELVEGQDYEIDYSLGRLRVINPSYLAQGTPLNVTFEENSAFSLQQKQMVGLRMDYDFNDKLTMGATYLKLSERPYTQKVNIGEDPIKNRVFGFDVNYSDEATWLTNAVDKLPFYSTNLPSAINFSAETAVLKPGHSGVINLGDEKGGVVSLDDFEGAINGFTLGGFNTNAWALSSTPPEFEESELTNALENGANRAKLSWYQIDRSARRGQGDQEDPYTRLVDQRELFNRDVQIGQTELYTFDLSYFPEERGPYNYDIPDGYPGLTDGLEFNQELQQYRLKNPESRWAGVMRYFQNTDFEAANYEFIDFWVLNPFMERRDGIQHDMDEEGEMVFHLGNVSEDIIRDNLQFYENGIPADPSDLSIPVSTTDLGRVGLRVPVANGFDRSNGKAQDLGYDGMDDAQEKAKFNEKYIDLLTADVAISDDPSGDNYVFFNDESLANEDNLITRLKNFNGPQGNAPLDNGEQNQSFVRGNRLPESEDLNNNRSLDQGEAHYEYRLKFKNLNGALDTAAAGIYYKQSRRITNPSNVEEIWYRFQVPLSTGKANNISGFRAIQFMRLYMTKFKSAKVFRMADFQLVRNSWRRSQTTCTSDVSGDQVFFAVDEVGVEENSSKQPFNYLTPKGIKQERLASSFTNLLQDEKSMSMSFCDLSNGCQVGINKLTKLNLNQYEKLQLFVHAESKMQNEPIKDGDLAIVVKLGKDMVNNYYEYELPLRVSDIKSFNVQDSIWLLDNFVDLPLELFKEVKKAKIADGLLEMDDPNHPGAKVRIKGVPSLGFVKVVEIGVRNLKTVNDDFTPYCGEVWVNELRATGLSEQGGYAAQARLQLKMADLGELNFAGNHSSIGYGALDQRLALRNQEAITNYSAATNLNLGKLLPKFLPVTIPFYAQYSKEVIKPKFDPYQLDLTVDELLEITAPEEQAEVIDRAREQTTQKAFNFTNVSVKGGSSKMPWNPNNFTGTYAYAETTKSDPIVKEDKSVETTVSFEYQYSLGNVNVQPFKGVKSDLLKLISQFNFNPLPSNFGFNTNINRYTNERTYRLPTTPVFKFDDQRYKWDRNYVLDWDFSKALRFNFRANVTSIVDELRQTGIADDPIDRPWVNEWKDDYTDAVNADPGVVQRYRRDNLSKLGRSKNYNHSSSMSYRLPFNLIPLMDWITASASYKADYGWTAGALITIDENGTPLGNIIDNNQSRSIDASFAFEKLYDKWGYLKKIQGGNKNNRNARSRTRSRSRTATPEKEETPERGSRTKGEKKDRKPSVVEKILIRPLMALRTAKFSYKEDFGTMIPGFMPEAELFGLSQGFDAPGAGFAAGLQPNLGGGDNSWLVQNSDWFNPSPNFNSQLSQNSRQAISGKITIEPFSDFVVDVDLTKNYRKDHTEVFRSKNDAFMQLARYDIGSFEVTHMGISTLFEDNLDLYTRYKAYKVQVSNELENKIGAGQHVQYEDYAEGYGPTSYAVNVPAFLAAYTGKTPNQVSKNIESDVSALDYIPKPNWTLRYDGLSKLGPLKDVFSSFIIRHGYRSTINVSKFNTAPDFNASDPYSTLSPNDNYYSQLEIPAISIAEQFNPLIGISMKTKKNMNLNFEYKKSRQLDLRLNANELAETSGDEIVLGFGYTIANAKSGRSTKKTRKRRGQTDDAAKEEEDKKKVPKIGLGEKQRALTINFDFSLREDESLIYRLENDGAPEANRGQRSIAIKPTVEYQMYKNLLLRFFVDYQKTTPKVTNQFPITRLQAGGSVRFLFN